MSTAATDPTTAARAFLRNALNTGTTVALTYGQVDVVGYVLDVHRHQAIVQAADTGSLHTIAIVAITEAVEA